MKPIYITSGSYAEYNEDIEKDPKFNVSDGVRIW